jgi:DUF1680 family protein
MILTRIPLILAILVLPCTSIADVWNAPELASCDDMHLAGMWATAQSRNAERMATAPLDKPDFILADLSLKLQRRYSDYSGDISGRWIGAAAFLSSSYPESFAAFRAILDKIPAYQKPDGHFGENQTLPRIDHDRDKAILWGNGRLLIGLVEAYERTGDPKLLETAKRLGDYFVATDSFYGRPELLIRKPGGYCLNWETYYLSCIEGLVALSGIAKDPRYLEEAKRIGELAITVKDFESIHSHGRLCAMRGLADLFAATGDRRWCDAAERDWAIFMQKYRLPTGGVKEVFEPSCNRDEGCAECDWLRLNLSLWRLTGKGCYLDEAERCMKGHFVANQMGNGGAGHRILHLLEGHPVAFTSEGEEAWWCCSEHWARATADITRFAITSGRQGLCINLIVDCEGQIVGPGGKWNAKLRETNDGLRISLQCPVPIQSTVRIHRPAWATKGARIEVPKALSVREAKDAWFVEGLWQNTQEIVVHLPTTLRSEGDADDAQVLLRGHDLLVATRSPTNEWLLGALPNSRPIVLWNEALTSKDGRITVSASSEPSPNPNRPEDWRLLELTPLRTVGGQPCKPAWFSFRLQMTDAEQTVKRQGGKTQKDAIQKP